MLFWILSVVFGILYGLIWALTAGFAYFDQRYDYKVKWALWYGFIWPLFWYRFMKKYGKNSSPVPKDIEL